jgi:hypothetical protein
MGKFSERIGVTPVRVEIQTKEADKEIRRQLWNIVYIFCFKKEISEYTSSSRNDPASILLLRLWLHPLEGDYDQFPNRASAIIFMCKECFYQGEWFEMYNLLEFIVKNYDIREQEKIDFRQIINKTLEENLSAYRFIDDNLVALTSEVEISAIEDALDISTPLAPIKIHLIRALELFSDRKSPDYRNSIKESISAVESCCKFICGDDKATLG